jgi:glutathione S-transferase
MKLYAVPRSPFAARVLAVLALKGLAVEVVAPPGEGLKAPAYLAVNPMGRLPTLVLDDGVALPESEVIVEFLEQLHPDPPLLPADPLARARARLIARVAELYVMAPLFGLFRYFADQKNPEVDRLFAEMQSGLGHVETLLDDQGYARGASPTLADCALAPFLFWVEQIAAMYQRPSPLDDLPSLSDYYLAMQGRPIFGPLLADMAADLKALRGAG